nr:hypothetical protein [Pseudomonas sp.]
MARLPPAPIEVSYPRIDDLPLYNMNLEAKRPASVQRFTAEIAAADALAVDARAQPLAGCAEGCD